MGNISSINLSSSQLITLNTLKSTARKDEEISLQLATGSREDLSSIERFKSQSIIKKAEQYLGFKDEINDAVDLLDHTVGTLETLESHVNSLIGILDEARNGDLSTRTTLNTSFAETLKALSVTVHSGKFTSNTNFLTGGVSLDVKFGEGATDILTLSGADFHSTTAAASLLGGLEVGSDGTDFDKDALTTDVAGLDFTAGTYVAIIDEAKAFLEAALGTLEENILAFGTNIDLLSTQLIQVEGTADSLTLAARKITENNPEVDAVKRTFLQASRDFQLDAIDSEAGNQAAIVRFLQSN